MECKVQGSGLAPWAYCPLIPFERGSAGSTGSEGSTGVVRRIIIWKRRGVLIALRAVVISSVVEKSLLQNVHRLMWGSTRTSFSLGAYTLIPAVQ